jgi:general secretion pathway protein G
MHEGSGENAATRRRGDTVKVIQLTGHRVALSESRPAGGPGSGSVPRSEGFTLIELVMTVTIMAILALGAIPLVKLSVRRQKEQQLHETLRALRAAIDEFHRDTVAMVCTGGTSTSTGGGGPIYIDPRSKVVISDCTIFGVDNIDRYPPDLDTLVNGVNVTPRAPQTGGLGLGQGNSGTSTLGSQLSTKKKVYLRKLPIDPITGKAEWDLRSCYDGADVSSWGGENVFDVRSKSKDTALNGEKYSDW